MRARKRKGRAPAPHGRESRLLAAPGGEAVTGVLRRVPAPAWDGGPWRGTSAPGRPEYDTVPLRRYVPLSAPPPGRAGLLPVTGRGWEMTVNTEGPGVAADERLRDARQYLDLKVRHLKREGMLYRIDEADEVLQRGEDLPPGSLMAEAHREGVSHLLGRREPWAPAGGWDHGWARGLPWHETAGA